MKRARVAEPRARLVVYDIETAFNIGGYFGPAYETSIAKVIQHGYVLGFAYKLVGERKTHSCYVWDFPLYKKEPWNDREVIKAWSALMEDADVLIGHNSDQFDNKVMTGRMVVHKLPPVPMPQLVDTKKIAKRVARFDSNKLDDLGELLGLGRKLHTDVSLWWGCMQGNPSSQRKMVSYNKQDVRLTEKLYLTLMPYDTRHPNMANITTRPDACPHCGAVEQLYSKGLRLTKTGRYRRWHCQACGGYSQSRQAEKAIRPDRV